MALAPTPAVAALTQLFLRRPVVPFHRFGQLGAAAQSWGLTNFAPASLALPVISIDIPGMIADIWEGVLRAVPKKKTSHMKKRHRQLAGKALKDVKAINTCPGCGKPKKAHTLCPYCVAGQCRSCRDCWGAHNSQRSKSRGNTPKKPQRQQKQHEDTTTGDPATRESAWADSVLSRVATATDLHQPAAQHGMAKHESSRWISVGTDGGGITPWLIAFEDAVLHPLEVDRDLMIHSTAAERYSKQ